MTNRFKCNGKMEPDDHGAYVLHADYKALEKKVKEANRLISNITSKGYLVPLWLEDKNQVDVLSKIQEDFREIFNGKKIR